MGDFFHGWRRKAGLLTLAIAFACVGAVARSFIVRDDAFIYESVRIMHTLNSSRGRMRWSTDFTPDARFPVQLQSVWVSHPVRGYGLRDAAAEFIESENWGFGELRWIYGIPRLDQTARRRVILIPYWYIALPVTLLSAYLLLTKTRVKKENVTVEK